MGLMMNFEILPAYGEGYDSKAYKWVDGKLAIVTEDKRKATIYLGHRSAVTTDAEGNETEAVEAWPVRMDRPVTRAKAINAAEMAAYGLKDAMEMASFNASLARKARANATDPEVAEHDAFIAQVKVWLDAVGIEN